MNSNALPIHALCVQWMIQRTCFWPRALIFLLCVCSILLAGCHAKKKNDLGRPVSVITLKESYIPFYKEYIGITQSIASVAIKARVEGFLLEKHFIEGTIVKKDQLLYVIDKRPFEAALALAKGTLARNIADEEYQRVEYMRMKELVKKGDVSQSQYDQVLSQYKAALASVDIAKAQVEEAAINLGYCSMFSPFDGLIGKRYVDIGNLVGGETNTLLVNVVQLNPMYVQFSPSVEDFRDFVRYRKNRPFKVEVHLSDEKKLLFHGKMDLVNNEADVPTSTIYSRATITNPKQLLLPGIYVNVRVQLSDRKKALLVPNRAVIDIQGQKTLFVVNDKNTVESRIVSIQGEYQQQFILKSGVKSGARIITDGLQKVHIGEHVNPQPVDAKNG